MSLFRGKQVQKNEIETNDKKNVSCQRMLNSKIPEHKSHKFVRDEKHCEALREKREGEK